jgi:hypothetical protein
MVLAQMLCGTILTMICAFCKKNNILYYASDIFFNDGFLVLFAIHLLSDIYVIGVTIRSIYCYLISCALSNLSGEFH